MKETLARGNEHNFMNTCDALRAIEFLFLMQPCWYAYSIPSLFYN